MAAPAPSTSTIACPQCGTRYRLPSAAIGPGRLVRCANCQTAWAAEPLPEPDPPSPVDEDRLFDPEAEARLDAKFEAEATAAAADTAEPLRGMSIEEIKSAIAPKKRDARPDPAVVRKRLIAFSRRQASLKRHLPMGRVRHSARIVGLTGLMVLVGGGIVWRAAIVEQVPDLAGVYAAIGLPVNVVGLQFSGIHTLQMLSDGAPVLIVSGRIASASDHGVPVPPVVVTLLSAADAPLYEWSLAPKVSELEPGEGVDFETRLTQPPTGAARVRLGFANARTQPGPGAAPTEGMTN